MPNPMLMVALAATSEISDDGTQWIEVMTTGEKLRNGPFFFTITRDDLDVYAASIREAGDRTPLDYDHSYAEGNGTRAAGWFTGETRIEDGPDGAAVLVAQVRWTPAAVEAIRAGEYRFISPEFTFQEKDAKTGLMTRAKQMLAATLTNRPFFKELAPVGADGGAAWDGSRSLQQISQAIDAAINPGAGLERRYYVHDVTADAALICEFGANRYWIAAYSLGEDGSVRVAEPGSWVEARQEWVAASDAAQQSNHQARGAANTKETTMPDLKAVAKTLGLAEDADESAVTAALARVTAENAAGAQAAAELHQIKVDQLIKDAVSAGKIPPVAADAYRTMAASDLENVTKLLDAMPAKSFDENGVTAGARSHHGGEVPAGERDKFAYGTHTVDATSLSLHAKAEAILAEKGKLPGSYTEDEYLQALAAARAAA